MVLHLQSGFQQKAPAGNSVKVYGQNRRPADLFGHWPLSIAVQPIPTSNLQDLQSFSLNTGKAEARDLTRVQVQPRLHSKSEARLGSINTVSKTKQQQQKRLPNETKTKQILNKIYSTHLSLILPLFLWLRGTELGNVEG